jgi:2-polyprenyl-6-methoxyphenol hydroxylase-like FAD-dependent oxidoreductase
MVTTRPRKVLVIGGGPVGALTALSLHRRGWDVELWESREGEYLLVDSAGKAHLMAWKIPEERAKPLQISGQST